ncbi:GPP34 family phosphoprotein [Amycolatopsis sp. NPDC004079]|uniref:GPP34 family phosphoprotein n=1 Tax=Amycolatopsis sp. NPDC004079 TaxID=3154549 RepID=UPI0033AA23FE
MLAKQMFLILHDSFTGRPAAGPELLRCGVAAAALADLILARCLVLEDGHIVVSGSRRDPVADEIGAFVVETVRRQKNAYAVRGWVEALGKTLFELIARSLVDDAVVRREPGRRRVLRRTPDRFPGADLRQAIGPRLRLERMLRSPGEPEIGTVALTAIVCALGIERVLNDGGDQADWRSSVELAVQSLPDEMRGFVTGIEAASAALSLKVRR